MDFLKGSAPSPARPFFLAQRRCHDPGLSALRARQPPHAREADGLRRWVYTAMAFSYYSNQVEGKLDIDARLVRERRDTTFDELSAGPPARGRWARHRAR